jgi:hypothetical protein
VAVHCADSQVKGLCYSVDKVMYIFNTLTASCGLQLALMECYVPGIRQAVYFVGCISHT